MKRCATLLLAAAMALTTSLAMSLTAALPARAQATLLETTNYLMYIPKGFTRVDEAVLNDHHLQTTAALRTRISQQDSLLLSDTPPENAFALAGVNSAPLTSPYILVDEVLTPVDFPAACTILAAQIRSRLANDLRALSGNEPMVLYSSEEADGTAFYVEYMVRDDMDMPQVHAFRVALAKPGVVVAYWFASGADYASYVSSLRPAAKSLIFLPQ